MCLCRIPILLVTGSVERRRVDVVDPGRSLASGGSVAEVDVVVSGRSLASGGSVAEVDVVRSSSLA